MTGAPTAAEAIDRLFLAPLDDFVALRKGMAAEVRAAGDVAGSREVLAAKKPSRTAWAINQVARRNPEALRAALDALEAATGAHSSADGDAMRASARAFRDRIVDVVKLCEAALEESGAGLNAIQARRLGETLRAAIGEPGPSRDRLMAGRLVDDLEVDDPFAAMPEKTPSRTAGREARPAAPKVAEADGGAEKQRAREQEEARARAAQREREARDRAIEQARRKVRELEEEARQARIAAHEAETAASRARAEAEKARRASEVAEERLLKAREALKAL
jgi:hypothetical protein